MKLPTKTRLTETEKVRLIQLLRQKELDRIPPILYPLWLPYRKKFITGGRGSGKSQTVIRIMLRIGSWRKIRVIWAREILKSIKHSIWDEIRIMIDLLNYPGWVVTDDKIYNVKTKSEFIFKGLRDIKAAKNMKSYSQFDYLILEEAETIPRESLDLAIPTIRKPGSEIWAIFNRYADIDPIMEIYNEAKAFSESCLYIECNWRDNPFLTPELILEKDIMAAADWDKYLHIWENEPIAQLEKAIMSRILVDEAMKRKLQPDGKQVIGVDVARFGDDRSKAYERRGSVVKKIVDRKHEAPILTAREIANKADNKYVTINIDNGGLGAGGMIDQLVLWGYKNVVPVDFGGSAKDDKEYANIATEMYFEMAEMLPGLSIPNDKKLRQDLTCRLYGYDNRIRKIIEKKKDFKTRYQRSPDDGDAIVLCCYKSGKKLTVPAEDREKMEQAIKRRQIQNKRRLDT